MKKVLISGVNGFVGSHLAEACLARGWEVHGTIRHHRSTLENIGAIADKISLHRCDIADQPNVADVVKTVKPDYLYHLAAQSYVPDSWLAPQQTMVANVVGTLNVLEAVRSHSMGTVVHVAGTSEEYGQVNVNELPITEDSPLRPLSPYGVSKASADMLARQYAASYGVKAVVTRAFNHSGPRRGRFFAESDWCRQVALAEAGLVDPVIRHGNLEAVRDYTDVRDIVRGYIAAAELGKKGEVYQLCSGVGVKMATVLGVITVMANVRIRLEEDPARMRPSDVPRLVGSNKKAKDELGWEPTITAATMLQDLLDYWRERVAEEKVGRRKEHAA